MEPNKQQKQLIENTEGVYLVDAGAGTGKTFTITRRYIKIVEKTSASPEEVFLATFTRNAAEEMSERIVELSDLKPGNIFDAPISTFHSHCQKIMERHGFEAPSLLGIHENVTEETEVLESKVRERQEFKEFYGNFRSEKDDYDKFFRLCNPNGLLGLIKSLASKGIIPRKDGWFSNSDEYLEGDFELYKKIFKEKNKPVETDKGKKQSELRDRMYSYKWKDFPEEAPDLYEIRGGRGTKSVRRDFLEKSFDEDRTDLKKFIHDIYLEYLKHCLSRNYLNFQFILSLTFVLLHEKPGIRRKESFEYVMIDEFQDTNEIQFKLGLLLSEKPNFTAVGDWKQSIYSFQHASVENIERFEKRIRSYLEELEDAGKSLDIEEINRIRLKQNYRSSQKILDFSENALKLPGNKRENPDLPETTSLESKVDFDDTLIEKIELEDEINGVLAKIQELVEGDKTCKDEKEIEYGDIAVLTRTRKFGLDLQERARELGIPVSYEGGIELFKTPQAVLLLAWLRILESDSNKGWAVVLEEAGYKLDESEKILEKESYPPEMQSFKQKLEDADSINEKARRVFDKYGYLDSLSDKIIEVLEETFRSSFMNTGQLIEFIEGSIEEGEIYEVDTRGKTNRVKVQTIHAAKGLEYPVVIISNINSGVFPSQMSQNGSLVYNDVCGIRQKKVYSTNYSYIFDNWRYEIQSKCLAGEYDEERRLMYVAMTRAESHLFFTAEKGKESLFFSELDLETRKIDEKPEEAENIKEDRQVLDIGPN